MTDCYNYQGSDYSFFTESVFEHFNRRIHEKFKREKRAEVLNADLVPRTSVNRFLADRSAENTEPIAVVKSGTQEIEGRLLNKKGSSETNRLRRYLATRDPADKTRVSFTLDTLTQDPASLQDFLPPPSRASRSSEKMPHRQDPSLNTEYGNAASSSSSVTQPPTSRMYEPALEKHEAATATQEAATAEQNKKDLRALLFEVLNESGILKESPKQPEEKKEPPIAQVSVPPAQAEEKKKEEEKKEEGEEVRGEFAIFSTCECVVSLAPETTKGCLTLLFLPFPTDEEQKAILPQKVIVKGDNIQPTSLVMLTPVFPLNSFAPALQEVSKGSFSFLIHSPTKIHPEYKINFMVM